MRAVQDKLPTSTNRGVVKYVVMDMNRGFRDTARSFLTNAKIIIDRFRAVMSRTKAMEDAR